MVVIELDRISGKTYCGYCHEEVDYTPVFEATKERLKKSRELRECAEMIKRKLKPEQIGLCIDCAKFGVDCVGCMFELGPISYCADFEPFNATSANGGAERTCV